MLASANSFMPACGSGSFGISHIQSWRAAVLVIDDESMGIASALLEKAMELPPSDRADLAVELIASLDGPADQDVDAAWAVEIERRANAVDVGTATSLSWDEVRRSIEREILNR